MRKVGFEVQIRPRLLLVTYTSSKKKKILRKQKKLVIRRQRVPRFLCVHENSPLWSYMDNTQKIHRCPVKIVCIMLFKRPRHTRDFIIKLLRNLILILSTQKIKLWLDESNLKGKVWAHLNSRCLICHGNTSPESDDASV